MFKARLMPRAERKYARIGSKMRKRIDRVLAQLEQGNFHHPNIGPLVGQFSGSYRYRLGDWRIMFRINDEKKRSSSRQSQHAVRLIGEALQKSN